MAIIATKPLPIAIGRGFPTHIRAGYPFRELKGVGWQKQRFFEKIILLETALTKR